MDENAHRFVLSGELLEREKERERERNEIEINTYLFVKWNKQIKLSLLHKNSKKIRTKKWDRKRSRRISRDLQMQI